MRDVPVRLGPLALLLTVIVICVTVLGLLTLTTAHSDLSLAQRYGTSVQARYALEAEGQAFLQDLDRDPAAWAALEPDGDGICWKTLTRDGAALRIGLEPGGDGYRVVSWQFGREAWEPQEEMGGLWAGD